MNYKLTITLSAVVMMISFNSQAKTVPNNDTLKQLKQELKNTSEEYQQKIEELEKRLEQTEQSNQETQDEVEQLAIEVSQKGNQKSANTFNPGIGLILNGRWIASNDDVEFELPGFYPAEEIGPGDRGLQIGESELNLKANVDDKFYASTTIAFGEETEVEEAFIQTLNLGQGFNIKAGRFFSNIGYLSSKHSHADDFSDRPLPYQAFLGGKLADDGIQTSWLAPTDLFWESGFELYRGESFPSAGSANSGVGSWTVFSHLGGDIGYNQNWRVGLSLLKTKVDGRETESGDIFSGDSQLAIFDFIYKWTPQGTTGQELKLQGEFLKREEKGLFSDQNLTESDLDHHQSGWYLEAVYRLSKQWRLGVRTSRLSSNDLPALYANSLLDAKGISPQQTSMMVDWSNSEFSRFRLQLDNNDLNGQNQNVLILQYIAAFGAHGAHSY